MHDGVIWGAASWITLVPRLATAGNGWCFIQTPIATNAGRPHRMPFTTHFSKCRVYA
jgi:hypothetical protein